MATDGGHQWTSWSQVGQSAWRRDCLKCGEFEQWSTGQPPEHGMPVSGDEIAQSRDHAAEGRDLRAENRDHVADVRDACADARDRAAGASGEVAAFDRAASRSELDAEAPSPDSDAAHSQELVSDRTRAAWDRQAAVSDRLEAAGDRDAASDDRGASAADRVAASLDELTGAHRRGAGFVELERELARARRTGQPLVLAFVDVNGLKAINDSRGHAAGDRMLREVVITLRAKLRVYDLIVRFGGDEFLCAIPGISMDEAAARLRAVNAALGATAGRGSVTTGLADLQSDDTLQDLIIRADSSLYQQRDHPTTVIDLAEADRAPDRSI